MALPGGSARFCAEVEEISGQDVRRCYQCGKCTAGCPLAFTMDLAPNQVMRMVQLGMENEVLNSQAVWLCAYCLTCTVRCPRQISVGDVMDGLRILARQKGILGSGRGRRVALFNESFLASVKRLGRLYEFGAMLLYNLKSGRLFQNADVGLKMFLRGKLKLGTTRVKKIAEMRNIFKQRLPAVRQEREGVRR
ncbi:MAG: 4Fe-4S dicluster domain-containing protein [Armatimonadetes bacterium]|nr:4Fe-4S dicluster domain-containing protein [Armatimonadota bacterium]